MAPPKLGDPSQVRKENTKCHEVCTRHRSDGENPNQPEGVMDVDAIPSPVIEPVSLTIVEEKDQQNPTTKEMDIDPRRELQNPSTEKNPCNKPGLGEHNHRNN
jgi:hypothetical protein